MKTLLFYFTLVFSLPLSLSGQTFIAQWDTTGYIGDESEITVSHVADGLIVSDIKLGNQLETTSGRWGLNTTDWSNALNATSGNYYYFSVTVESGYKLELDTFNLTGRSSGTGPKNLAIYSDVDGFAAGKELAIYSTSGTGYTEFSLGLSSLGVLSEGTYEFRVGLVDYTSSNGGTIASGGTHRVMNPGSTATQIGDIPVNLTGTLIPEPGSLLLASFGLLGLFFRRRTN